MSALSSAILLTDLSAATRRNVLGTGEEGRGRGGEKMERRKGREGGREGGREERREGERERYMYTWNKVRKKSDVIKQGSIPEEWLGNIFREP